ncbi:MAG: hypothetical protein ACRD50_08010 [Candidatus Acidiferrales bacterium]
MRSNRFRISILVVGAMLAALAFETACNNTSIGQIKSDPARYTDRTVTIIGRVTSSFGVPGNGAYEVTDGSGSIWVLSSAPSVPEPGTQVRVTGRIETGISFGGRSFGTVLREVSRQAES